MPATLVAPANPHADVDRLITKAVLGTLMSVQKRTFAMTKSQFDAWIEQQINSVYGSWVEQASSVATL